MNLSKTKRKLRAIHSSLLLPLLTAVLVSTSLHVASYGAEAAFLAFLYVVRFFIPCLHSLSAKHGPEDVALTVILVAIELVLCSSLLAYNLFPDTSAARRIRLVFHRHRYGRHHWSNMRPRHYRRYIDFLRNPLANSDDVHFLPESSRRPGKSFLYSRSRYLSAVRVKGSVVVFAVAFTRLASPASHSPFGMQARPMDSAIPSLAPLVLPLLHGFARGSLVGGGSRASPLPDSILDGLTFSGADADVSLPGSIRIAGVLEHLLPQPGTSALAAADHLDGLPDPSTDLSPALVSEAANTLLCDAPVEALHDAARLYASELLHIAVHHAPRLLASLRNAPDARSVQLLPGIRLPLAALQPLLDIRSRVVRLQRWHEALQFFEPYTGPGAEGVTQLNQQQVAFEVHERLATLPHDASFMGPGGFELSPLDLATFLSTRWFSDTMLNAGLDWIARELGPQPTTAIANCFFLQWLEGIRSSDHNRLRFRRPSAFVSAIRSGARIIEFPVFADGNHWAGIRVDLKKRTYSYRDGLHESATADADTIHDIERFLSSVLNSDVRLTPGPSHWPMPEQTDNYSCGALYLTTLIQEHLGGAAWHQELADMRRMELFLFVTGHTTAAMPDVAAATTTNPHDRDHDVGGSGSATPVAAGLDSLHVFLDDEPPAQDSQHSDTSESSVGTSTEATGSICDFFAAPSGTPPRLRRFEQPRKARKPRKPRAPGMFERWMKDGEAGLHVDSSDSSAPRLTDFFTRLTPEEAERRRLAARARDLDEEADKCRVRMHQLELRKLQKKANTRALARDRQRRRRERLKFEKAASDKPSINDVLRDSQQAAPASSIPTSERSRPRRDFKIDQRANNKPCGRKRTNADKDAKTVNWTNAFLFEQIMQAAREAGPRMRPAEIVKILQRRNPTDFATLTPQVLGRYIERPPNALPRWKPSVLKRAQKKGGTKPLGFSTRSGFLDGHPELVRIIVEQLSALRSVGVPINVPMARGIMLAHIQHHAPALLEQTARDGSRFKCSDVFVRKFLYAHLKWVPRTPTRAARKIPADADQQLFELFVRLVLIFRDAGIRDGALFINFDQTQVVVADPNSGTYDVEGAKQVDSHGVEEKRAWTAVVGVSSDGAVLPTQVVMKGKSDRSLPSAHAPQRDVARDLGFLFSLNPETYWSDQRSMEEYFDKILVPYFTAQKSRLGYADDQECVVLLDCWSVHRSKEFRELVRSRWPWIRLRYVPGGMTGLAQPCDVGIQRPYKLSIRRSQLQDIVAETLRHIESHGDPATLSLDTRIGTLRDRSVSWFVDAYRDISHPELVKKAFEHCLVRGGFNLSFESITSSAALKLVRELPRTDPELWQKIAADYGVEDAAGCDAAPASEADDEWEDTLASDNDDDTAVLPSVLMESLTRGPTRTTGPDLGMAEQLDPNSEEERGRGKRFKTLNSRYRDFEYNGDSD